MNSQEHTIMNLKREADRRLDAINRCLRLLEHDLPITAYENLKDEARSMERFIDKTPRG